MDNFNNWLRHCSCPGDQIFVALFALLAVWAVALLVCFVLGLCLSYFTAYLIAFIAFSYFSHCFVFLILFALYYFADFGLVKYVDRQIQLLFSGYLLRLDFAARDAHTHTARSLTHTAALVHTHIHIPPQRRKLSVNVSFLYSKPFYSVKHFDKQ